MTEKRIEERACREAFEKAGYWPNELMWKAWQQSWAAAVATLSARAEVIEPIGFAVRMADGPFVGIWQDRATADLVRTKQPAAHNDQILSVYTEDQIAGALLSLRAQLHHSLDNTDEALEHLDRFAQEVLSWCEGAATQEHPDGRRRQIWNERAAVVRRLLNAGKDAVPA